MNINSKLQWIHDESERKYGESCAYSRCYEELKRLIESDLTGIKAMLDSAPEPSNPERATWPPATKDYVEILEHIVDGILANIKEARHED